MDAQQAAEQVRAGIRTAKPVAIVTGTSSGIGREAVLHLRDAGFLVVATARRLESIQDLDAPGSVECMRLDVTQEEDRAQVVQEVLRRHGRIEALVNNAGFGAMLAVEDTSAEALRAMLETNVVGLHELTRLVLPVMRRQGVGRIVNVSSIAGHVSVPLMGAYCASKFALRALTTALHNEVRRFGIFVSLVEPGVIKTNFGTHSLAQTEAYGVDPPNSPYKASYAKWHRTRVKRKGAHPRVIARRIVHACSAQSPSFHYFAPFWDSKLANALKRLLPDAWTNFAFRAYFRA